MDNNMEILNRRKTDGDVDEETHTLHHTFIKVLIDKENQRIAFRKNVIEKTTASLIWSFIVFLGMAIWKYITTAGVK
jgi:ethanolamine utilization cobalamin adenosyltransferase